MINQQEFRQGIVVSPYHRLNPQQVELLDRTSLDILRDPGIWCYNRRAADLFHKHGAAVTEQTDQKGHLWRISLPSELVKKAVSKAPSQFVLGARDPANRLLLDAQVPRVYFGSGSETNVWIETELEEFASRKEPAVTIKLPRYKELRGSAALLCRAAKICDNLNNLDFFIRPVNIQDDAVTEDNHDVNKFFASLNNITKHVQAGLTKLERLGDVIRMAELITGGPDHLRKNPVISFIACVFKSPLQMVDDTTDKVFAIVEAGIPLVISSSPQGGSTAPVQETGMVAQINAEILAGITLTQLIKPGAPVLYGSVPVRARMDDLHDLYGCPEFNQYNHDCVQLARHYQIPCYSTAGVADAKVPGMQACFEKLLTHTYMTMTGAQYIHYAFGLLNRTNSFCPVQAVIDNEHIDKIKQSLRNPDISEQTTAETLKMVRKVMNSTNRLYARHARKAIHSGTVSDPYLFSDNTAEDNVIAHALAELARIESRPAQHIPGDIQEMIFEQIPGLLPELKRC